MKQQGADDILYHHNGEVTECPRSNFFIITKDNVLVTAEKNMLKGVTRKNILAVCKSNGITVEVRDLHLSEISTAKEAFITSSTKRIIPVHQVDDIVLKPNYEDSMAKTIYDLLVQLEN
jgi:D-alanine transaminase/branched-chain amino acid aminotransferase